MKTLLSFIWALLLITACNRNTTTNDTQKMNVLDFLNVETLLNNEVELKKENSEEEECGYRFIEEEIEKNEFEKLYSKYYKEYKPNMITDFDSVKKLLGDVVEWLEEESKDENGKPVTYGHPAKINFRNGTSKVLINEDGLESLKEHGWSILEHTTFSAYFPDEDILLLYDVNCGDDGEQSYILATGEDREVAGDPQVTYYTPSKTHRIRGFYNGYVMIHYFQEKQEENYINLCPALEYADARKIFYINDSTLYCEHNGGYEYDYNKVYYKKIIIKETSL